MCSDVGTLTVTSLSAFFKCTNQKTSCISKSAIVDFNSAGVMM
jgi:hypothetical protein